MVVVIVITAVTTQPLCQTGPTKAMGTNRRDETIQIHQGLTNHTFVVTVVTFVAQYVHNLQSHCVECVCFLIIMVVTMMMIKKPKEGKNGSGFAALLTVRCFVSASFGRTCRALLLVLFAKSVEKQSRGFVGTIVYLLVHCAPQQSMRIVSHVGRVSNHSIQNTTFV